MYQKFFILVKALQAGKVSSKRVGSIITEAAKKLSSNDVNSFIKNKPSKQKINEVVKILKEVSITPSPIEPMYLDEEDDDTAVERNPIAKTFTQKGNFEQYIQRFSGLEMKPKEYESITNYTKTKPIKQNKFFVRYESTDDFGNSTITMIKKLREGNDLVFTTFQVNKSQNVEQPIEKPEEDDVIVNKSVSFRDEIEGGKILADVLQKLNI